MRESAFREFAFCLDVVNPSHVLDIEGCNVVVVDFILEVWGAIVSSEEHEHHFV